MASEAILERAAAEKPAAELRARMSELAEALFQSCRAQLTATKYHGMSGRGNSFDAVDSPLSDAAFLRAEIAAARRLADEPARAARLVAAATRDDPGPGGFYDDLGRAGRQPHLVRGPGWANDPAYYDSALRAFGKGPPPPNSPRAWWDYAEMHYDTPLRLRYSGLDRSAGYAVRVVYLGEGRKIRLEAGGQQIHDYIARLEPVMEFEVPAAATAGGDMTLSWNQEPGGGGSGRGCQVAEVWLIRRPAKP